MHFNAPSKRTTGVAGSVGAALLVASAVAASPASAGIAGSTLASTSAPDVRSADVTRFTRDDGLTEQVRVCFDQTIQANGIANASFRLVGYASFNEINPTNVIRGVGGQATSDSCVLLSFPDNTDVRSFTAVEVTRGAVTANNGTNRTNIEDSVPIGAASSDASGPFGRTTGPNLAQVQIDAANNQVIFITDHDLVRGGNGAFSPNFAGFFVQDINGNRINGTGGQVGDNVVTVNFPNAVNLLDVRRVGLDAGAVFASTGQGQNGAGNGVQGGALSGSQPNSPDSLPVNSGLTTRPVITSATRSTTGTSILVSYDRPVATGTQTNFRLFKDTNQSIASTSVQRITDTQVRVTFGGPNNTGLSRNFGDFVRIQDLGGGVVANDTNAFASLPSTGGVGTSRSAPGFTSAPDFTSASFDSTGVVTVNLDQPADDTTFVDPANFRLFGSDGQALPFAAATAQVTGSQVRLEFGTTALIPAVGVSYTQLGNGPLFSLSNVTPFDTAILQSVPFAGTAPSRTSTRAYARAALVKAPKVTKFAKHRSHR